MKAPVLLRVEDGPGAFAALVEELASRGLRVGWLELAEPGPLPPGLAAAAAAGVLRAVAAGAGRTLALKPVGGGPVLRDLLREHFLGCRLVLVVGEVEAPLLRPAAADWEVVGRSAKSERLTTGDLADRLRRPAALAW